MAKKQVKRSGKKPTRAVRTKSSASAKRSVSKAHKSKKEEKYQQPGAPWWKMHLPG